MRLVRKFLLATAVALLLPGTASAADPQWFPLPTPESRHFDDIWLMSSDLHLVVSPLLAGGVLAVIGFVAVLAVRWERRLP